MLVINLAVIRTLLGFVFITYIYIYIYNIYNYVQTYCNIVYYNINICCPIRSNNIVVSCFCAYTCMCWWI